MIVTSVSAPYKSEAIRISLTSSNTTAYRPLHCLECGRKFIEREGSYYWNTNLINRQASPVAIDLYGVIITRCGNCDQRYQLSFSLTTSRAMVPLHEQTQSIYYVAAAAKVQRVTKCLECGKGFQRISDRIAQVVDNVQPLEFQDPRRLAPIEAICEFTRCRQRWALVV